MTNPIVELLTLLWSTLTGADDTYPSSDDCVDPNLTGNRFEEEVPYECSSGEGSGDTWDPQDWERE